MQKNRTLFPKNYFSEQNCKLWISCGCHNEHVSWNNNYSVVELVNDLL